MQVKACVLAVTMGLASLLVACGDKTAVSPSASDAKPTADKPQKVVVYSARAEHLIQPLFDAYTQKTGVKVEYITDKAGSLLARLQSEGVSTQADVLLTTDVGNLEHAKRQNVLQIIESEVLEQNVPEYLQDADNMWFGLTQRARTIVYASDRVAVEELADYATLASEAWSGRLCLRTSKKVYNQSLVASFIAHYGEQRARELVKGWVENLAVSPFSNDTAAMKAVMAGQCDVTVVNTYYFGRLEADGESGSLKIFWPGQHEGGFGVHMNISGAGITRHAKRPEAGKALVEWLSSTEAQEMLAGLNLEFPVHPEVPAVPQVKAWGDFVADQIPLSEVASHQKEAVRLIDEAGYK